MTENSVRLQEDKRRDSIDMVAIRNDLCSGCGRWHDQTGRPLLGWYDWHGKFWPLERGHMPSSHPFDDLGGREYGSYGSCAMGAPEGTRGALDVDAMAEAVSIVLYDEAPWDWPDDVTDEQLVAAIKRAMTVALEAIHA